MLTVSVSLKLSASPAYPDDEQHCVTSYRGRNVRRCTVLAALLQASAVNHALRIVVVHETYVSSSSTLDHQVFAAFRTFVL